MPTVVVDQLQGVSTAVAIKAPCRVATTANITLSGEQTIDGVAVVAGDRVLVKDQTNAVQNGVYVVSTSGWTRAADFDSQRDITQGTLVSVFRDSGSVFYALASDAPVNVDSDTITFTLAAIALTEGANVDDFGAVGDGVTDDTAAFTAALASSKRVTLSANKTYVVGDVSVPENTQLDLNNAIVKRKSGASHALIVASYKATLCNGEVQGGSWFAGTTSALSSAGASTITLTSVTGLAVGMRCFYASSWSDGGIEANEVSGINPVTKVVTLSNVLKGNVASGAKVVADFALVKVAGSSLYAARIENLFVRNFCVGVQSGQNGAAGASSFSKFDGLMFEDFCGAALVIAGNNAGEDFTHVRINGGDTQVANYTGNGSNKRFAVPYNIAKKVYRWGSEPTIRYLVNGVQRPVTDYTVDTSSMEVVAVTAPANGATVQVQHYEYSAFGVLGQNISISGPSSVERISNALVLACNVGLYLEDCTLGFFSNIQSDTCGYAGALVIDGGDLHFRACDFLYSPFGIIFNNGVSNSSVGAFSTSLIPDADEFSTTGSKTELTVRAGSVNIQVDYSSWASKNLYTRSVSSSTYPDSADLYLTPDGIALGGVPSGRAVFYDSAGAAYVQVDDTAQFIYMGGTGTTKAVEATGANKILRVGNLSTGGAVQLACGAGVKLQIDGSGRVIVDLPTSAAGLPVGSLWNDSGTVKVA